MRTAGLIAAAGLSSRMGCFKPLLRLGGETVIRRIVATLQAAGASSVVVVTGHNGEAVEEDVSALNAVCIKNPDYAKTQMLDSVKIGLRYLNGRCDRVLFTPGDVPLFSAETAAALLACGGRLALPCREGRDGHPLLIPSELIPSILEYEGGGGLRGAVISLGHPVQRISVDDAGAFLDADTPEDFSRLQELLYGRGAQGGGVS